MVVSGDSLVGVGPHQQRNQHVAHHGWQAVQQEGLKEQLGLLGRMEVHWLGLIWSRTGKQEGFRL